MRIKVEFTLEINSKVIRAYISEMGDGESVKEFVTNSIMDAGLLNLDEVRTLSIKITLPEIFSVT
jgi:hypothetical protein